MTTTTNCSHYTSFGKSHQGIFLMASFQIQKNIMYFLALLQTMWKTVWKFSTAVCFHWDLFTVRYSMEQLEGPGPEALLCYLPGSNLPASSCTTLFPQFGLCLLTLRCPRQTNPNIFTLPWVNALPGLKLPFKPKTHVIGISYPSHTHIPTTRNKACSWSTLFPLPKTQTLFGENQPCFLSHSIEMPSPTLPMRKHEMQNKLLWFLGTGVNCNPSTLTGLQGIGQLGHDDSQPLQDLEFEPPMQCGVYQLAQVHCYGLSLQIRTRRAGFHKSSVNL